MLVAKDLTYTYPSKQVPSVGPIDVEIEGPAIVVITGPTGCGKSTLLRLMAGLLQRHGQGRVGGSVRVDKISPAAWSPPVRAASLGFVNQCPGDQLVTGSIADELAFGLESVGASVETIQGEVLTWTDRLGFVRDPGQSPMQLSGGQQQQLVIASAVAAGAGLLLLDEPLSQLDPPAAARTVDMLMKLRDLGRTIMVVEHRLEPLWGVADRIILMEEGQIQLDATPAEMPVAALQASGVGVPPLVLLQERIPSIMVAQVPPAKPPPNTAGNTNKAPAIISIGPIDFKHPGATTPAFQTPGIEFHSGERVAVLGHNGSGKSTLLELLSGTLPGASVQLAGRIIGVPQDPDLCLFSESVWDELAYAPRESREGNVETRKRVESTAESLGLTPLLQAPPQALSRGQRGRVAVAAALTAVPDVLALDEPTAGQDVGLLEHMMKSIDSAMADGLLLFATHDMALALRWASRVLILEAGVVVFDGPAYSPDGVDAANALKSPTDWVRFCRARNLPVGTVEQVVEWLE